MAAPQAGGTHWWDGRIGWTGSAAEGTDVPATPVSRLVELTGARDPGGRQGRGPLLPGSWVQALDLTHGGTGAHLIAGARRAVMAAWEDGHRRVVCGSAGPYGAAVAQVATELDMQALVVVPSGTHPAIVARIAAAGAEVVPIGDTFGQVLAFAFARSRVRGLCADLSVGGPYGQQVLEAAGEIVEMLTQQSTSPPRALWVPVGSGATVAGIGGHVLRGGWPITVFGVGIAGGNSVVSSWPGQHRPVPRRRGSMAAAPGVSESSWPLVRDVAEHGAAAMDMVRGTGGEVVGIATADLIRAQELLARHAIHASPAGAAGLAGLLAESARGRSVGGRHIAVVTG